MSAEQEAQDALLRRDSKAAEEAGSSARRLHAVQQQLLDLQSKSTRQLLEVQGALQVIPLPSASLRIPQTPIKSTCNCWGHCVCARLAHARSRGHACSEVQCRAGSHNQSRVLPGVLPGDEGCCRGERCQDAIYAGAAKWGSGKHHLRSDRVCLAVILHWNASRGALSIALARGLATGAANRCWCAGVHPHTDGAQQ